MLASILLTDPRILEFLRAHISEGPEQAGAEYAWAWLVPPFEIPLRSAGIGDIYLFAGSGEVLVDELERRLWLAVATANAVVEVVRGHVPRIRPQEVLSWR